jgi:hypothetical protein
VEDVLVPLIGFLAIMGPPLLVWLVIELRHGMRKRHQ